jgi:hypothetical protein
MLLIILLFEHLPKKNIPLGQLGGDFARWGGRPNDGFHEIYRQSELALLKNRFDDVFALTSHGRLLALIGPNGDGIQLFRNGHLDIDFPGPEAKPNSIQIYSPAITDQRWSLILPNGQPPRIEQIPEIKNE